jgi:hypothetical protein
LKAAQNRLIRLPIGASTFCSMKTARPEYWRASASTAGPAAWQVGQVKRVNASNTTRRGAGPARGLPCATAMPAVATSARAAKSHAPDRRTVAMATPRA